MASVRLPPVTLAGAFVENSQFRRERAKRLQRHRNNLKKMKPTIDATVPKCYVTFNKAKRKKRVRGSIPRARAVQIAQENEKLLQRLIHIEKEPGPLNVETTRREYMELHKGISFVGKKSSLHSIRRKKRYDKIVRENEEILQRLIDARERPQYYNAADWEASRQTHRHYMSFMTRYPEQNPPPDPKPRHRPNTTHAKSQKLLPLKQVKQITCVNKTEHTQSMVSLPKRKPVQRKAKVARVAHTRSQSNEHTKEFDQETWTAYLQDLAQKIENAPQAPPEAPSTTASDHTESPPHSAKGDCESEPEESAEASEHSKRYSLRRTSLNPRVNPDESHVFIATHEFSQVKQADEEAVERQRRRSLLRGELHKRDSDLDKEKRSSNHLQEMLDQQVEWRKQQERDEQEQQVEEEQPEVETEAERPEAVVDNPDTTGPADSDSVPTQREDEVALEEPSEEPSSDVDNGAQSEVRAEQTDDREETPSSPRQLDTDRSEPAQDTLSENQLEEAPSVDEAQLVSEQPELIGPVSDGSDLVDDFESDTQSNGVAESQPEVDSKSETQELPEQTQEASPSEPDEPDTSVQVTKETDEQVPNDTVVTPTAPPSTVRFCCCCTWMGEQWSRPSLFVDG